MTSSILPTHSVGSISIAINAKREGATNDAWILIEKPVYKFKNICLRDSFSMPYQNDNRY